jgi:hypothetical protein
MPLVVAALTTGCQLVDHVIITTTVYPNGSFDRRIVLDPSGSKERLTQEYILPSGIAWEVRESPQEAADYQYEAFGHFDGLASDYARRDEHNPGAVSRNQIDMTTTPEGLCRYEETFRDTTDVEALRAKLEQYYRARTHALMSDLAGELMAEERPQTIEVISRGVTLSMLGWLDQTLALYEAIEDESSKKTALSWVVTEQEFLLTQIDRWWKEEGAFYPTTDAASRIKQAVMAWSDGKASKGLELWFQDEVKRSDGAYSRFLDTVDFVVTVEMPAEITDSNAHERQGRRGSWTFDNTYFWLKAYTLTAVSSCHPPASS